MNRNYGKKIYSENKEESSQQLCAFYLLRI